MVTATDDISARIAAVESDIRNINTQLAELNANQRQLRDEVRAELQAERAQRQAELQELRTELRTELRAVNARIDRVFWAIITFGSGIILTIIGVGAAAVI